MADWKLDNIKKEIEEQIERDEALLAKWQAVTFPTKKNGEPFAVMSKNIEGAKYQPEEYAIQQGENEIEIYTRTAKGKYVSDLIAAYKLVEYLHDEKQKAKTENYLPKIDCLEQVYKYDLDDIKQAIKERIKCLEKDIAALKKQLENAEEVYNTYYKEYHAALEKLEEISGKKENSMLYYAIKKAVE